MIPRPGWNIESAEDDDKERALSIQLKDYYYILNKGIIPTDNMRGSLLNVTFAALNSNVRISHGLDFAPTNYFVVGLSAPLTVYDGTIVNDKTFANFRCSGTTGAARIFVF